MFDSSSVALHIIHALLLQNKPGSRRLDDLDLVGRFDWLEQRAPLHEARFAVAWVVAALWSVREVDAVAVDADHTVGRIEPAGVFELVKRDYHLGFLSSDLPSQHFLL